MEILEICYSLTVRPISVPRLPVKVKSPPDPRNLTDPINPPTPEDLSRPGTRTELDRTPAAGLGS